jgi:membrane protease YdiL (CAAX protease family)
MSQERLRSIRRRAAIELAVVAAGATIFLSVMPHESVVEVPLALVALGYVAAQTRDIRARFWAAPAEPVALRCRRADAFMALVTLPPLACFLLVGRYYGRSLLTAGLLTSFVVYLPWATLQQGLFQFYLHGRLRALLPREWLPLTACLLTGICYGLVHLPDLPLVALTTAGGMVWSYCYQRDRCLPAIAASHALLGATFYTWVHGHGVLTGLVRMLSV